jgi:phospholipase C
MRRRTKARRRWWKGVVGVAAMTAVAGAAAATPGAAEATARDTAATPIEHLVVVFDENISFDHYFGTYPHAANTDGVPFHAKPGTPTVNGLTRALLAHNPNRHNPRRLGPKQALTCDQNHDYSAEQKAFDGGLMDKFVEYTQNTRKSNPKKCEKHAYSAPGLVMSYFDGNTVTALWNYAQRFAMSDNFFGTNFGHSSPGAINLISGQTHGAYMVSPAGKRVIDLDMVASPDARGVGTLINDPDPVFDDCSAAGENHAAFTGRTVGDLLNAAHVTWGWFQGGFRPTSRDARGRAVCGASHANIGGTRVDDYMAHHEPFQYYRSTANPHHLPPSSVAAIGHTDRANHQYDLTDFYAALDHDNLPAVSFVKAPAYQDGHAGYSDPLDEQHFLVQVVNKVQESRAWQNTAVIIAYDDSDGWYDHQMPPILNPSRDPRQDGLNGPGVCGHGKPLNGYQDRCGYGPRLPMLVISPYAKMNYVDHALIDQTSILRFIEDNWLAGHRIGNGSFDALAGPLAGLFDRRHPDDHMLPLDPTTGQPR